MDYTQKSFTKHLMGEMICHVSFQVGHGQNIGHEGASFYIQPIQSCEAMKLVELILPSLGSLLSGVDQQHVPVRALHASFFEFLTDRNRSKTYYVDPSQHRPKPHAVILASYEVRTAIQHLRFGDISCSKH
jgi:hypothetical protein